MPEINIIILNWNKADETLRCLDSLHKAKLHDTEIVVVDNGSNDNSVSSIRSAFANVTVIETGTNLGYAEGNNTGIRYSLTKGAKFLFVLNNDTRVAPDALDCLLKTAKQNPQSAFFGPKILHLPQPDLIQSAGIRLDYFWRSHLLGMNEADGQSDDNPVPVSCVSGAALFIRSEALAAIGLLDPDFYLYREDIDWCLRAQQKGYQILYVPGARIWHASHADAGEKQAMITYYMTRNSLLLLQKHRAGWVRSSGLLLRFLLTALSWSIRPKWRNKRPERNALMRGVKDFYSRRFGQGSL